MNIYKGQSETYLIGLSKRIENERTEVTDFTKQQIQNALNWTEIKTRPFHNVCDWSCWINCKNL